MVGDSAASAKAMGVSSTWCGLLATAAGGLLAGIGGAFLSLYYPGSWNEGLSSGQGLMAVALVIFARWNPLRCVLAALLFGAAGALGPVAAGGRRDLGLPLLQRRALYPDAGDHDRLGPVEIRRAGSAARTVHREMTGPR
jgi:branched-subunit amino acid ABC-type transport system permease component